MYERILVPTDGGPLTDRVAEEAVRLATLTGGTVYAISVVDTTPAEGFEGVLGRERVDETLRDAAAEAVDDVRKRAEEAGVPVETAVLSGTPYRKILDHLEAVDADAVVMGTHGRTGIDRMLLGSVAERVLRVSPVPVLVVKGKGESVAVDTAARAETIARETLAEDGDPVAALLDEPYRERTTWVVPAETEGGATVNVHVNAATGETRVARIG